MRVTIASRIFLPETSAASFRLDALARELVSRGHQVTVVTATTPKRSGEYHNPTVRVRRAPVLRNRDGYLRGYLQYLSFDLPLWFRLLFARRPDVIIAEPPPTTGSVVRMVGRLRRIPTVYYAADLWSDAVASIGGPSLTVHILRRIESRVLARAAAVLTVNSELAGRIAVLAPDARVTVVGNGVDLEVFTPGGPTRGEGDFAVYPGTMSEWQGVDIFIRAMPAVRERLSGVRLVFLGQGSARADLERLAVSLGVGSAVEFHDPVPAAVAAEWIRGARFGLVSLRPGQGYDFAVPTKLLASVASGTPVLFAGGDGPAAELLASFAPAGVRVAYDVAAVAVGMTELFRAETTDGKRADLGEWADRVGSLGAVASRAADVVTGAVGA